MKLSEDALLVCSDESIQLLDQVRDALVAERQALIQLDIEKIMMATSDKLSAVRKLEQAKKRIRKLTESRYGVSELGELESRLDETLRPAWQSKYRLWSDRWEEVSRLAQTNQEFLQHSLRNLGLLVDNLKQLYGKQALYDHSGRPKDLGGAGKVTGGKY